ncbi:hypothetical protein [Pyrodictium abyssi]
MGKWAEEALKRLREMGLDPYRAWLCAEYGMCPEDVDHAEVDRLVFMLVADLEAEGRNPVAEWEKRHMEERAGKRPAVATA